MSGQNTLPFIFKLRSGKNKFNLSFIRLLFVKWFKVSVLS